ncbi:MAG: hypothetical protein KDD70_12125 [Bdellovibrionales bacterium]|nr:hypothetical protein [Bdellovibrionales bacterium]
MESSSPDSATVLSAALSSAGEPVRSKSSDALNSVNSSKKLGSESTGPNKKKFLWEYRITPTDYMNETTAADREALREALNKSAFHFLSLSRAVYLESLGIVFPILSEERSSHQLGNRYAIREETVIRFLFEKCGELIAFHKEKHQSLVELPELAEHLYAHLPIEYQIRWDEKMVRRLLRGLCQSIRTEVVVDGYSGQLSYLGDLFALHNRQGENATDWFAGANILLYPRKSVPVRTRIRSHYEQPVLESAWELLEAGFGPQLTTFTLHLADELEQLGYDKETFTSQLPEEAQTFQVGAFVQDSGTQDEVIVFCTDGLREIANPEKIKGSDATCSSEIFGCELITQIRRSDLIAESNYSQEHDDLELLEIAARESAFVRRLLAMAWILLQTRKDKTLRPGLGFSSEGSRLSDRKGGISGIFTTQYNKISLTQRACNGRFAYVNILGVTEDELRFSELRSAEHLEALLQCKMLDQVNSPKRKSLFAKAGPIAAPQTAAPQTAAPQTAVSQTKEQEASIG